MLRKLLLCNEQVTRT